MTMADNLLEVENVTSELIKKAIQIKEGQDAIYVKDFSVSPGSSKGENFMCVILAVVAKVEQPGGEKEHHLIVKSTPSKGFLKFVMLHKSNMFYTEVMTYKELIPEMAHYQKEKGMQAIVPSVPQYYHSVIDEDKGILILDDLRRDFYKLADKRVGLDKEHCELVMKELGGFHALSWAMKKRNPDNIKKYEHLSRDSLFNKEVPVFFHQTLTSAVKLVTLCSDNEEVQTRVKKLLKLDLFDVMQRLIKPEEPYAVICHGDLWTNNLLFKYDQKDEDITPTSVKLIDFQISRYAPPTTDLAYFFYTSTTKDTRKKHQKDLLRLYYSSFMSYLETLEVDFPEFTFEVLEQQLRVTSLFGILFACFVLPTVLLNPEDAVRFDTKDTEEEFREYTQHYTERLVEMKENNTIIKERLIGAIEEAIDLELI